MRTDAGAGRCPRVVVAPDKFKGTLTAVQAADAMRVGVLDVLPDAAVRVLPMADGGEGTLDAVLAAGGRFVEVRATDPVGRPLTTGFAALDDIAYVESARACGTEFVEPPPGPPCTHTWGVGELLAAAFDLRVRGVVLTVGGTASTDGGAGMLAALGCAVLGPNGRHLAFGGADLRTVRSVDLAPARARRGSITVRVATDPLAPRLDPGVHHGLETSLTWDGNLERSTSVHQRLAPLLSPIAVSRDDQELRLSDPRRGSRRLDPVRLWCRCQVLITRQPWTTSSAPRRATT